METIKRIPDNTIIYKIYSCVKNDPNSLKPEVLEILVENCIYKISGFLNRYVWQNESFNLSVVNECSDSPPHLEGKTCFDDNIDDEWFIVFLLYYLSKHNNDIIIQIQDNDGDFLLIEAADYIPKWLDPDTSENRVFIYRGQLHIIPIAQNPGEITPVPSGTPSISNAIAAVRDFSSVTKVSDSVQNAIERRINEFPQKIDLNKHRAHCYLPCAVAAILKEDPKLLPHAVKAFYLRDPIDLKVIFTRCLYAQLMCQKYEPDKRTGWNLPSVNNPQRKAHELGMKLSDAVSNLGDETDVYTMEDDPRLKKLSAWRVFIPQVMMKMDQNCKYYHVFRIEVQRIDVRDEDNPDDLHWTVERRYNEFYVLEAKLTEFHGELSVQLPAKRSQQNKGLTFLESKRPEFERYLQTLLTLPALQGSELLFQFLKSPTPTTSFLPDIKLGKMIKTVPMKLMKEKGQHLLPFLQAFIASTEAAKPKPSKEQLKDVYDTSSTSVDEKLTAGLFRNNFETIKSKSVNYDGPTIVSVVNLKELYDYVVYLAVEVVHVPVYVVQMLATCDILLRHTLQAGIEWYLDVKLQQAFKPQRLAELLNLLRDVLFFEDDPPRSRRQKAERARQAL